MDFKLSRENNMIKEAIRDWVAKECTREQISEWDEADQIPGTLTKKLAELGFSGMTVSEEYGGEGKNILATCMVIEHLAVLYAPLARLFAAQTLLGGLILEMFGSVEQKSKLLPAAADGKCLVALAADPEGLQLPRAGSGAENEFLLNGDVPFVTHARQADYLLLPALRGAGDDEEKTEIV